MATTTITTDVVIQMAKELILFICFKADLFQLRYNRPVI
jgi:hypothetical protein